VGYSGRSYVGSGRGVSGYYGYSPGASSYYRSGPSIGYSGKGYGGSYGGRGYSSGYHYAFASHSGWNHNRSYYWNGRHYGWYGNGWYAFDYWPYYGYPYPYYGYYDSGPAYTVYGDSDDDSGPNVNGDSEAGNNAPTSVQVQQELSRLGYYHGPVDGIIGAGTRSAIEAYQRDNGLHVTGTINSKLLDALDVG
jgi:Putative peptidoglycan binding domain